MGGDGSGQKLRVPVVAHEEDVTFPTMFGISAHSTGALERGLESESVFNSASIQTVHDRRYF